MELSDRWESNPTVPARPIMLLASRTLHNDISIAEELPYILGPLLQCHVSLYWTYSRRVFDGHSLTVGGGGKVYRESRTRSRRQVSGTMRCTVHYHASLLMVLRLPIRRIYTELCIASFLYFTFLLFLYSFVSVIPSIFVCHFPLSCSPPCFRPFYSSPLVFPIHIHTVRAAESYFYKVYA